MQPRDKLLLPVPSKRGRRRPPSSSEVSENADLRLSKSALPQPEVTLPVTPRGNARKRAQNLLAADTEAVSAQDGFRSGGKVEILDTPRRRTRRVPRAQAEQAAAHEQTPAQPAEESTAPRTTVRTGRRGRKRRSVVEEAFPHAKGADGSPLLPEDRSPSGCGETSRTLTDRIRRTRSCKTAVHQKPPVEENESFLFSPPLTKLTKKCKGRGTMFICKVGHNGFFVSHRKQPVGLLALSIVKNVAIQNKKFGKRQFSFFPNST